MALQLSNPSVRINNDVETLFPNITDGRSTYSSPLMDILNDLWRKHIVAAATTTGNTHVCRISRKKKILLEVAGETCTCQTFAKLPSTLFGGASFGRTESVEQLNDILPESRFEECGNSVQRQNPLIPLEKYKNRGKKERPRFRAKLDLQWRRLDMLRPY
jgi:hypothetical protein